MRREVNHDFWAERGEVLLHKRDRDIYHVTRRYIDVDKDVNECSGYYRIEDDSHTVTTHYLAENIEDDFVKMGYVVNGKPIQAEELSEWY